MKSLWLLIAATLIILAYHAGGAKQRQFEALCAQPGVLCTVQIKPDRFTPQLQGMLAYMPAWVVPVWMEDDGSGVVR